MLVYKITNTVNDRIYVGLTTCDLKKRWREHKCAANTDSDKPLYRAMRKHGIENFRIDVIYEASSIEDMRAAELRFIDELGAHIDVGGYNLTDYGYVHGAPTKLRGEASYNAVLTEELVAFIRDPQHWDISNVDLLKIVEKKFAFSGTRDALRDARRGDTWRHLNSKYAPIHRGCGVRHDVVSEEVAALQKQTLDAHRAEAQKKSAELRKGKRGNNAKLSEDTVRSIFFSQDSLMKTAQKFGVSKKMVLLIKQRKAHVYLTQGL